MAQISLEIKKQIFYLILTIFFLIFIFGFYRLQIKELKLYSQKSLQNSVKMITRIPVRGNIYDRYGILIVGNRPAFSLYLIPAETTDRTIKILSQLNNISEEDIREQLKDSGKFQAVKIIRQVDMRKLAWIQENILELPGVEWKSEPKRHYNYRSGIAHILGTLGEIDENELNQFSILEPGDIIGKKALERAYDDKLRGYKGYSFVKVDAIGRIVEDLSPEESAEPYPGNQLYLTIDLQMQMYADSLMEGKRGALIAIDTRNGEILTMLSKPDYNLSFFTGVIQKDIWKELVEDPHHPLYDRACQSGYPPGSTYKLVAAIAALSEKVISPRWSVNCPGYFIIGRKTVHCWKADGHGTLDLMEAIKNSCNVYFYRLGLLIGIDYWHKYSKMFRFGNRTGIELINENPGLVPSRSYYNRVYGEGKWTRGMLANLAIGQGELLVTPLQMVQFVTILANKGEYHVPHLGLKLVDPVTDKAQYISIQKKNISGIDSIIFNHIREGMRQVVDGGTGWRSTIYGIPSAGKTGTAQNPGKNHAWFIGFAPFDNPEIAICVLVENGGAGGAVAAPIAGQYLKRYFYYQGKYDYRVEKRLRALAIKRDSLRADSLRQLETSQIDSVITE